MTQVLGPYERPTAKLFVERLGISRDAADLYLDSDVVDLHVESFSFARSVGYDLHKRHTGGLHGALCVGQADIPRLLEAGVTGATWVLTANPWRPASGRLERFRELHQELSSILTSADDTVALVATHGDYQKAKAQGRHAAFLGIQGANLLPPEVGVLDALPGPLLRITLMHLTNSHWGTTSAPSLRRRARGLTKLGRLWVERMNELRIGVDLAHIHPDGFWDALDSHDASLPPLVTHTGFQGAHRHWRNLDDAQMKAVAERGGILGVMFHSAYLGDPLFSGTIASVVRHIRYAEKTVGAGSLALGSDWDGAICTPRDMPTCLELPLLVDALLKDGMKEEAVQGLLGKNALGVILRLKGS